MDQRIINLYDEYTHKPLTRNEFLRRLVLLTGSTAAAMAILPMIEVNQANAAITPAQDLFTERISYPGVNGDMQAYVARLKAEKKYAFLFHRRKQRAEFPIFHSNLLTAKR